MGILCAIQNALSQGRRRERGLVNSCQRLLVRCGYTTAAEMKVP